MDEQKIYDNIKIVCHEEFDIKGYIDQVIDKEHKYLSVLHQHGKKEGKHWHVSGVLKEGVSHLQEHPLRKGGGQGTKPISKKTGKYDHVGAFNYLLKPKEWAEPDCVVETNMDDDELFQRAIESALYAKDKEDTIERIVEDEPSIYLAPEDFHMKVMNKVLASLIKDKKGFGPHITHKVRSAIYKKDSRYESYICKKYI